MGVPRADSRPPCPSSSPSPVTPRYPEYQQALGAQGHPVRREKRCVGTSGVPWPWGGARQPQRGGVVWGLRHKQWGPRSSLAPIPHTGHLLAILADFSLLPFVAAGALKTVKSEVSCDPASVNT